MPTSTIVLLVILGVLLLGLLSINLFERSGVRRAQKKVLNKIARVTPVQKNGKRYYINIDGKDIELIFFGLKAKEVLTINSPTVMEVDRGINKKPLLINYNYSSGCFKWLLIVPSLNRVRRAINESEIEFVTYQTEFNNFRVIREDEIDKLLEEVKQ